MKAFHFRLDQALRWRTTQVEIEKASVSAAVGCVMALRGGVETCRAELKGGAAEVSAGANGAMLGTWAAWQVRTQRQIADLERKIVEAEKILAARMLELTEANRRMHLLEELKEKHRAKWRGEFDRETENFAAEAFLLTLQSRERTGA